MMMDETRLPSRPAPLRALLWPTLAVALLAVFGAIAVVTGRPAPSPDASYALAPPAPMPVVQDSPDVEVLRAGPRLQCAIYARQRTGVALSGAAITWWAQAQGKYARSSVPAVGSILALGGTAGGHVAVVSAVVSPREIRLDHANWMGGGETTLNAPAVDVSAAGDWSEVRVWHPPTGTLGLRAYPGFGFIHPEKPLQVAARWGRA